MVSNVYQHTWNLICEPQNITTINVLGLYVKKRLKEQEMGMLSLPSIPHFGSLLSTLSLGCI